MEAKGSHDVVADLEDPINALSAAALALFERRTEAVSSFSSGANSVFMELAALPEVQALGQQLVAHPGYKGLPEIGVYFELPNGGGWRISPYGLGSYIVTKEWEDYALLGKALPPMDAFAAGIARRLQDYLRAARSGRSMAQQLVSIRGLQLPPSLDEIAMPTGSIRRNPAIPGFEVDPVESSTFFLSGDRDASLRKGLGADAPDCPVDTSLDHEFKVDLALVRLTFLLSAGIRVNFGVHEWRFPFGSPGRRAVDSLAAMDYRPPPTALTDDIAEAVNQAVERLKKSYHPSLGVAYARLASALMDRADPADKLIDSVMVWECIFGSKTESVLRITASMARLLEQHAEKRRALWKELKTIYTMRSNIVHGATATVINLYRQADQAAQYSLAALNKLADTGPEFLAMSSTDRSAQMLLD